MRLLQLSSAQGPAECELAVAKALQTLQAEAEAAGVSLSILEDSAGHNRDTFSSVLLALEGERSEQLASQWNGSLLWICQSPYRPTHGRKNWYFGAKVFAPPAPTLAGEICFEFVRASGPGGQHVNKTDSAVRATHKGSGFSVKVQSERSQHANKRLAVALIGQKLAQHADDTQAAQRMDRRLFHHQIERSNPIRTFRGMRFIEE
jgi:peptide chain release factor